MCIYYSDAFLWLKTGLLFGVNARVFVNVYVFIIMMLFLVKNY